MSTEAASEATEIWAVILEPVEGNTTGKSETNEGGLVVYLWNGPERGDKLEISRVAFERKNSSHPRVKFETQLQKELDTATVAADKINEALREATDRISAATAEATADLNGATDTVEETIRALREMVGTANVDALAEAAVRAKEQVDVVLAKATEVEGKIAEATAEAEKDIAEAKTTNPDYELK